MKDRLRGFLGFLGLVEDEYGEYGPSTTPRPFSEGPEDVEPQWGTAPAPAPVARTFPTQPANPSPFRAPSPAPAPAPATLASQRTSSISVLDAQGNAMRSRPQATTGPSRGVSAFSPDRDVAVVAPQVYDDSRRITDLLRSNRAVVLTTLDIDPALARRLVDFTAGTAYALNSKIEMLIRGVYLISPQGMHLGPEAKEQLRAANYHQYDQA